MKPLAPDYKRALYYALGLHAAIVVGMLFQLDFPWENKKPAISYAVQNVEIVQAHTVPQAALDAQNKRIADEKRKKEQEALRIAQEKKKKEEAARLAELEKKKKAEAARLAELEKQKQAEAARVAEVEKQKQAAEAARLAELEKQKQAEAERLAQEQAKQDQLLAEQAAIAAQQQTQLQEAAMLSEIERYSLMVKQKVMQNWLVQRGFEGLSTELHVRVAPGGTVLDVQIVKKSGNDALDRSAVSAVHRASPLPVPTDPAVFDSFREIRLILRPEDVLG